MSVLAPFILNGLATWAVVRAVLKALLDEEHEHWQAELRGACRESGGADLLSGDRPHLR